MRARRQRRLVLWRPCGQHRRSVGVVIVTMCTVVVNKAGFSQLVAALGAVGRVARVAIDEVRLVPLWSGFFISYWSSARCGATSRQVHQMRSGSGSIAGRSTSVAVCCETTAEVDGIAAGIGALLELHVTAGMADAPGCGGDEGVAVAA